MHSLFFNVLRLLKFFPAAGRLVRLALAVALVGNFFAASAQADIATGLLHHWTFDETTGTTAVDIVAGNNGTLHNWDQGEAMWVPGKIGGALDFGVDIAQGNDNYVITASPISSPEYTISFWLYARSLQQLNPRLVTPTDGYEGWVVLNQQYDRGVGFYYQNGVTDAQDPNEATVDQWDHYAVTFDRINNVASVYRNGALVATDSVDPQATADPQGNWVFGHHDNIVDHIDDSLVGMMDDIRIYGRLLSPDDVLELSAVPEPSSWLLGILGLLGVAVGGWRRLR